MAQYDLTPKLLAFLDPHLGFPLLSHLGSTGLYDPKDLAKAQFELAKRTAMVDYTLQFYKEAFPGEPEPSEIVQRREENMSRNSQLEKEAERVLTVIEDPNLASTLKQDKAHNLEWLQQNYSLTLEQIEVLYRYGRFRFACGNYSEASSYLYHYYVLAPDNKNTESLLWGKLACDTLTGNWERALEDLRILREHIDSQRASASAVAGVSSNEVTHEEILQKRVWLLHWSLYVFFNHASGRIKLIEMFLSPVYLNAIQMSCWWLLRYVVAALIITRRHVSRGYVVETGNGSTNKLSVQAAQREVGKVIQMEAYRLQPDPLVDFFHQLYSELDFDRTQEELAKAEQVARQDFFLQEHVSEFVENARFFVCEVYFRIHQHVDMADLSKRLNMSKEEGAKWIAQFVSDTKADATVNAEEGVVHMNAPSPLVYQSVIDKTRGITLRTSALAQAMERHMNPASDTQPHARKDEDDAQ